MATEPPFAPVRRVVMGYFDPTTHEFVEFNPLDPALAQSFDLGSVGGIAASVAASLLGAIAAARVNSSGNIMDVDPIQDAVTSADWPQSGSTTSFALASGALTATAKAAAGASLYNTMNQLTITNTLLTAGVTLSVKDGAAGNVLWSLPIPVAASVTPIVVRFYPALQGSANTLLQLAITDPTAGTVTVSPRGSVVG